MDDKAPQDNMHKDTGLKTDVYTSTHLTATHLKYWHYFPILVTLISTAHQHPELRYCFNIFYSSYFLEIALHSSQHILSKQHSKTQRLLDKIKWFCQDKKKLLWILDLVTLFLLTIDERSQLKPSSESAVHTVQIGCWKCRKIYTRKMVLILLSRIYLLAPGEKTQSNYPRLFINYFYHRNYNN